MNAFELKDFFNYCWSVLDVNTEEKEKTEISFFYNNGLVMKVRNIKGFSTNYFPCDLKEYERIISKINKSFILHNHINDVNLEKNYYQIKSDSITINFNIYSVSQFIKIKSELAKIKQRKLFHREQEEPTNFEKEINLCRLYKNYLKTCSKNSIYTIYTFYSLGFFVIKIDNGKNLAFYRKISCNKERANNLQRKICEDLLENHNMKYSYIIPVTNDEEALNSLMEKGMNNHFYILKNDTFTLRFLFDINDPEYEHLNEKAKILLKKRN